MHLLSALVANVSHFNALRWKQKLEQKLLPLNVRPYKLFEDKIKLKNENK